jgi:arylsulfatase A-like enzyme
VSSRFNRRDFLGMSGASVLSRLTSDAAGMQHSEGRGQVAKSAGSRLVRQPNIVMFMPDEMRADALACYGNPVTKTPNLDRLAREGTRFSNCHVQFPVCGASRCSMLTGWPTSVRGHRSLFYFLRPEEPNLFRYLRQAGYDVFWFGKNDALAAATFWDSVTHWRDSGGESRAQNPSRTPNAFTMLYPPAGDRKDTGDYIMLHAAFEVLDRKESDRPFCIFLPLSEPHPPYTVPEDFYKMYSPSSLPPLAPASLPKKPDFHAGIRETYGLSKLDDGTLRQVRAVYYGQVSYSDWLLGELLAKLESTGRNKDTVLFVMSDHGDYAGDYGLVEKWPSGLEDCLTHVPLLVRAPGGKPGAVAEDMVELYDVMQTSLDLAATKAHHTHFSRSLLPQLSGERGDPNRAAFAEGGYNVYEPQCFEPKGPNVRGPYVAKIKLQNEQPETVSRCSMVRTKTHKLIRRPQGQSELYDLGADPQELRNLCAESSVAAIQQELQLQLLDHYVNTTGIAPMDKDSRECPPFYPTRDDLSVGNWQQEILDQPNRGPAVSRSRK